ncbi:MAG: hypothetical protein HFI85_03325 [Clostridia bacterium]|jgi:hypothetical protein|nr:hypothetical protein [Clostridia bacterium]
MANVIRNMNFKPIIEKIDYQRLSEPQPNSNVNMRVWDELTVERIRTDAVKVTVQRNVKPEPECIFSIEVAQSVEVIINTAEFEELDDAEDYFKASPVARVLASNIACILAELTLHSQIGPMITAPVCQFPQ